MSIIRQHALNESEAKENQQMEITSSIRTVSIFQALCQSLPSSTPGPSIPERAKGSLSSLHLILGCMSKHKE